jgi:putative membrane protein (TIGR04086 family)
MLKAVVLGTLLSLGIWSGAVGSGVAATVMSSVATHDISVVVSFANLAAPFLGAFAAGWMTKKRGCVYGAWVGVLYTLTAFLVTGIAFPGLYLLNAGNLVLDFCLGCVGGVCGVNTGLYAVRLNRGNTRDYNA